METINYQMNGADDQDAEVVLSQEKTGMDAMGEIGYAAAMEGNPLETPEMLAEIATLNETTADYKDKMYAQTREAFWDWIEELPHAPQMHEIEDWWIEKIKELI